MEKWWSIPEVAERWNMSDDAARRWVKGERGIVQFVRQRKGCRRRIILRIPDSVLRAIEQKYRLD